MKLHCVLLKWVPGLSRTRTDNKGINSEATRTIPNAAIVPNEHGSFELPKTAVLVSQSPKDIPAPTRIDTGLHGSLARYDPESIWNWGSKRLSKYQMRHLRSRKERPVNALRACFRQNLSVRSTTAKRSHHCYTKYTQYSEFTNIFAQDCITRFNVSA
ncbi:hypothetical protein DPMN_082956 [Dreissena polymorpha]|uniref:Uncharacterized protein n=1 Tax=Dreissena polymorpha TaxID=45954 RepID=A0A9D4BAM3_DREPO|nr:hypothetical protein DPMN_082956 [Dreissena polymorpha]